MRDQAVAMVLVPNTPDLVAAMVKQM